MNEPMDNNKQAVDIKGYRVLSNEEKNAMNLLKDSERVTLDQLRAIGSLSDTNVRSLRLAQEYLQTGFMWAIRAIARPNGE